VRTSHRYQLRVREPLSSDLETFALARGLGMCAAIRLLVRQALDADSPRLAVADSPAALAGLIAAEHAVLMVASVLPEGERRMHELAPHAAVAAEERLAVLGSRAGD
jgi:hypothetical protein